MWTIDQDLKLAELRKAGKSYKEIGDAMGKTRMAIAGRLSRLGMQDKKVIKRQLRPRSTVFKPVKNPHNRPIEVYTAYGIPATLNDCTGCRFQPEGTKLFCNAKCDDVYCERHRSICYIKVKK